MRARNRVLAGFLILAVCGHAAFGDEHDFDYRLVEYPDYQNDCVKTASGLASQIAAATGVRISTTHQQAIEKHGTCNITITYFSQSELKLESTSFGESTPLMPLFQGSYRKAEECQANITEEKSVYEKATGLKALVAYCVKDWPTDAVDKSDEPYSLRIDGFGKAAKHSYVVSSQLPARFKGDEKGMVRDVSASLASLGVPVARVSVRHDSSGVLAYLILHYYWEYDLSVSLWTAWIQSDSMCPGLLPFARDLFNKTGQPVLTAYCTDAAPGVMATEMEVLRLESPKAAIDIASESYKSYEECVSASPEVYTHYKTPEMGRPVGAFCSLAAPDADSKTMMSVFVKRD